MEHKNKIFILVFLIVVVLIAFIITLNYNILNEKLDEYIRIYGYPAVFVFSFLADLFEQPIGPEIPSSFAVIFGLNILVVFFVSVMGSYASSLINFYIGRKILSRKIINSCHIKKYSKYCKFFFKYGKLALFLAAITPIPYVTFCWITGAFHMKTRDFFLYGLIPRAFRIGIVILLVAWIL